ncbi:MAG: cytochrome c oxidase assembly factor Coa1 family protein [Candidatus Acidiferrales bacterium]
MSPQANQIPNSAAASPDFTPTAARKSWFSCNWKWFVPTLVLVVFVLPLALCGGAILSVMRNSDVAKQSLLKAQSNPLLVQKLGTPIEEGWLVGGSFDTSTTSGDADLAVPIAGPKGKGKIYVTAQKSAGVWSYRVMEAAIEGSDRRINLLSEVTPGAEFPPTPPGPPVQPPQVTPSVETQPAPPAPQPADPPAASSNVIQTQETTYPGVVAEFTECRRKEGVLNIKVRFHNTSNKGVGITIFQGRNYEKYYVTAKSKKYFILKDSEGAYLTPTDNNNGDLTPSIGPGENYTWWAKYPAPPADVKKINLLTPITTPFDDVPITDQ